MNKSGGKILGVSGYTKEKIVEQIWLCGTSVFVCAYLASVLKALFAGGSPGRLLHTLCCVSLMTVYGSCVFLKTPAINIQKLLRDGNFRCLLVFCSFLGIQSALIPLLPFLFMSALSFASYIIRNKAMFKNKVVLNSSAAILKMKTEITIIALKIEVFSVLLLFVSFLFLRADLFAVVSYSSMAYFEYITNPCMRQAVSEMLQSLDGLVSSSPLPDDLKQKYEGIKRTLEGINRHNIPIPTETKK